VGQISPALTRLVGTLGSCSAGVERTTLGTGSPCASKLVVALMPLLSRAALSYASAA
jgi:hypothetical protein